MTTTSLILLRHGEPEHRNCLLGHLDSAPIPDGLASCLAAVAGLEFGLIVSSPLRRAAAAAEAIAGAAGLRVTYDDRWQELDFGDWDGKTVEEIANADRAQLEAFWSDPDSDPPPGGEPWSAIKARVAAATLEIASTENQLPVLVVTHAGAIRALVAAMCSFDFAQTMRLELPYASWIRLNLFVGHEFPPSATIHSLKAP